MIKTGLIIFSILFLPSCSPPAKTTDFSDDYVLIEFAAKLEEEHERLKLQPLDKLQTPN